MAAVSQEQGEAQRLFPPTAKGWMGLVQKQ